MRSLSALAVVLLLATTARAEEPATAPAPEPEETTAPPSPLRLTLVEVFDTRQALVFDRVERQYLVVSVGTAIQGYRVESVMREQLELVHPDLPGRHYIVTMPVSRDKQVATATPPSQPKVIPAPQSPAPAAPAPVTPKPEADPEVKTDDGDSPIDPYADAIKLPTREIKVVRAPPASRPGGEATARSPEKPAPETPEAAAPPAPPAPEPGPVTLSRKALDAALSDLDALSNDIELSLARGGVVIESIEARSLGYLLGLRAGDLIRSVAGVKTRKLEDGADVYVRLGQVKRFDIEITRDDRRLTLPVVIK